MAMIFSKGVSVDIVGRSTHVPPAYPQDAAPLPHFRPDLIRRAVGQRVLDVNPSVKRQPFAELGLDAG